MLKIDDSTINRQPNRITFRKDSLSLLETQIFYLIVKHLKKGLNIQNDLFYETVNIDIPAKLLENPNPKRLRNAVDALTSSKIWIYRSKNDFEVITPFPRLRYKSGIFYLTMFRDVADYFCELSAGYTEYGLKAALSLKKTYSQRMYELLSRWKDTGKWKIEIAELKKLVGIEGKKYNYSKFKERVLQDAQKEINSSTDISFTFKEHKKGRSYADITFYIKHVKPQKESAKVDDSVKNDIDYQRIKDILSERYKITKENYINIIVSKKKEFWKLNNQYLSDKSTIKSPSGYILTGLGIK